MKNLFPGSIFAVVCCSFFGLPRNSFVRVAKKTFRQVGFDVWKSWNDKKEGYTLGEPSSRCSVLPATLRPSHHGADVDLRPNGNCVSTNRQQLAMFFHTVYIGFLLFVPPESRQGQLSTVSRMVGCPSGRTDPPPAHSALSCRASSRPRRPARLLAHRCGRPRIAPPTVCPGFGLDR